MPLLETRRLVLRAALIVAVLGFLGACGDACGNPFIVTDSFTDPPEGLDSPPDSLHDYAVGTTIGLDVRASRLFVDMNVVEVVSKNSELLTVDDQTLKDGVIHVKLTAV